MRLQKYLADCGVASRRASEQIIKQGRVRVNGQMISAMGALVEPEKDIVSVDGKRITPKAHHAYYALYKPRGVVSTNQDDRGRKTVTDFFSQVDRRLFPVGRLDYDSEGLLLVTDDGAFAQKVAHPGNGVGKIYRATVSGAYSQNLADELLTGIDIGDEKPAKAVSVQFKNRPDGRAVLSIVLEEGRNRMLRRMLEAQKFEILRLTRLGIGDLELGDMKPGTHKRLTQEEAERALINPPQARRGR